MTKISVLKDIKTFPKRFDVFESIVLKHFQFTNKNNMYLIGATYIRASKLSSHAS